MTGKRLTPARVRKAYLETGLVPQFGVWFSEFDNFGMLESNPCACAASVVCLAEDKKTPVGTIGGDISFCAISISVALGLTYDYISSFAAAFDNEDMPDDIENAHEGEIGFKDGVACRKEALSILEELWL